MIHSIRCPSSDESNFWDLIPATALARSRAGSANRRSQNLFVMANEKETRDASNQLPPPLYKDGHGGGGGRRRGRCFQARHSGSMASGEARGPHGGKRPRSPSRSIAQGSPPSGASSRISCAKDPSIRFRHCARKPREPSEAGGHGRAADSRKETLLDHAASGRLKSLECGTFQTPAGAADARPERRLSCSRLRKRNSATPRISPNRPFRGRDCSNQLSFAKCLSSPTINRTHPAEFIHILHRAHLRPQAWAAHRHPVLPARKFVHFLLPAGFSPCPSSILWD